MFERIMERYGRNYVTLVQLRRYVELQVITEGQFTEICGEEY